jgi:BirA family biotin operon repressor/biotin-[acetyl-CoA-carboxylase] ligase
MQERRAEILRHLADGPVTGPALAEQLDVTRAAVWKHIEALREEGFEIASSGSGYTLESIPEFGGSAIEFGLSAPFTVEYHDSIGSTNSRARELAEGGEQNVAVVADRQTGGRGRLDRAWSSPSGGIWLSILLRPGVPAVHAPLFTLAAAVATTRAVRALDVDATIKWPNDVQVDGRKLAGILTEMEGEADRISWLVVGIGLNANVDSETLPGDRPATSLRAETGDVNRRELTQQLLETFWELSEQPDSILSAWRELTATLGQRVRVETQTAEIVGEAVGIEFPGSLIVDTGSEEITVTAGDCEHLRPAE